jgi:hypothetical protein
MPIEHTLIFLDRKMPIQIEKSRIKQLEKTFWTDRYF